MKKSPSFMALLSVTVVMGSLLSGTGAAQGCLYEQYEAGISGFSEPLSGSNDFTQTSFLESREMTMGSAAIIAGLFGLSLLFRQFKEKHKPAEEQPPEASTDQPAEEQPPEASTDDENEHPEAPGGQLDVEPENQETAETVAEQEEEPSAPATKEEENKEVVAAQ